MNALVKNTLRQIKGSMSRFLSILAIVALGCGFFAGLKSTCPDMVDTAQKYYLEYDLTDLNIKTTMGISENDIEALWAMRNVRNVQPGYYADMFTTIGKNSSVVTHVMSIDLRNCDKTEYVNRPRLIEGRLPESTNECVVDQKMIDNGTYELGDEIVLRASDPEETENVLSTDRFTVVGGIESVAYVSYERGSASIGNGVITFFMYVPEKAFSLPVYTEVFVTFNDTRAYSFNSDEYASLMEEKTESVKNIAGLREVERYNEVYGDAMAEIEDAQAQLDEARAQYEEGLRQYETEIMKAEAEIMQAETQLEMLTRIYSMVTSLNGTLSNIFPPEAYEAIAEAVNSSTGEGSVTADDLTNAGRDVGAMIDYLREMIDTYEWQLWEAECALSEARTEGAQKLADAKRKIDEGQKEIDDALEEINAIEKPSWYIFDRANSPGYSTYEEDALRVDNVSKIFPFFFILVAALVCTTTMTRMVEDDRSAIGTLKALGYSDMMILSKYLIYATLASLAGSVIGLMIGFKVFPLIIFSAYRIMYVFPPVSAPFRPLLGLGCIIVSLVCTNLSAYFVARKELKSTPAALMRPKVPKAGKRLLIERIRFIWDRIGFLGKVTIRNMVRYRTRVLMTVIGVAGCTALLFTGFGLKYAIGEIVDLQYKEIFTYDLMAVYKSDITEEEHDALYGMVEDSGYITEYTPVEMKSVSVSTRSQAKREVYLMVTPEKEKLRQFIVFRTRTGHEDVYIGDSGIVVTEKLARLYHVSVGDSLRISISDTRYADLTVTGITENYAMNYVYMSSEVYRRAFREESVPNSLLINMVNASDESRLASQLLTDKNVLSLNFSSTGGDKFRELVGALDYIVILIIVCSGALAFVVLYNLANINVTERTREIATIKVLGFRRGEVAQYINRENTLSSAMGIVAGLFLGIPLESFVIHTAEVDAVMFVPTVDIWCYVYSVVLAAVFTAVVNLVMRRRLAGIDMIESLKSVE